MRGAPVGFWPTGMVYSSLGRGLPASLKPCRVDLKKQGMMPWLVHRERTGHVALGLHHGLSNVRVGVLLTEHSLARVHQQAHDHLQGHFI